MTHDGQASAAALSPRPPAADDRTNVSRPQYAHESGGPLAPDPAKPRRMHYGDAVRILGTIAVVIGHEADMRLFQTPVLNRDWWVMNAWDALTRWAVPAYVMLSGALLLDPVREEPPAHFYRKRLARIGVPLVFWTAFFMWFDVKYTGWRTWPEAFKLLAVGKPYTHLHFIFRIAGLYFFTPMMRIWLRHTPRRMQWGAVIAALALACGDSVMNGIVENEPSVFSRFVPFVGYYLLGYLMRDFQVSKATVRLCWIGFFITAALLALGTGFLVRHYPAYNAQGVQVLKGYPSVNMVLYDFLSPVRIIMAICVWIIFVNTVTAPWPATDKGRQRVAWWAATTLGLYLVHPMFREILYTGRVWVPGLFDHHMRHGYGPDWPNIWLGVPLSALMVYLLSLITTAILMKIPYVRRITG